MRSKTLVGENIVKLGGTAFKGAPMLQNLKRGYMVTSGENTFDLVGSAK